MSSEHQCGSMNGDRRCVRALGHPKDHLWWEDGDQWVTWPQEVEHHSWVFNPRSSDRAQPCNVCNVYKEFHA